MIAILIVCLAVSCSILIVAFAWNRIRGVPISSLMPPGVRKAARFAGGPFSFSIAIHLAIILALVIAVHESPARELLILQMDPGSIHPPKPFAPLHGVGIGGTKAMDFVMADVKARMTQLAVRVRQLVPIARVGVVVFGGKGDPIDMQPLTLSTAKLQTFLGSITAKGGGEWQENTLGGVQAAVTRMDWKPYARKVIVLIGDSPPEQEDFAPLLALI